MPLSAVALALAPRRPAGFRPESADGPDESDGSNAPPPYAV